MEKKTTESYGISVETERKKRDGNIIIIIVIIVRVGRYIVTFSRGTRAQRLNKNTIFTHDVGDV